MVGLKLILTIFFLQICSKGLTQLKYDEYGDIMAYSLISEKIQKMKLKNQIATLTLPSYNNDSLFWEGNINQLISEIDHYSSPFTRVFAITIDTTFQFFDVASRIRISEGYVWLLKITSPTANGLSVSLSHRLLEKNEYVSAYTNWYDSLIGTSEFQWPLVLTQENLINEYDSTTNEVEYNFLGWSDPGNTLYLEVFSPNKHLMLSGIRVNKINYQYSTRYRLKDAPDWIRKRYPEIDFDNYRRK